MKTPNLVATAVLTALAFNCASSMAATYYIPHKVVSPPGGASFVKINDLNNNGEMVGSVGSLPGRAVYWQNHGQSSLLPFYNPSGNAGQVASNTHTSAYGINNLGVIVGAHQYDNVGVAGRTHLSVWSSTTQDITVYDQQKYVTAKAINDLGQVLIDPLTHVNNTHDVEIKTLATDQNVQTNMLSVFDVTGLQYSSVYGKDINNSGAAIALTANQPAEGAYYSAETGPVYSGEITAGYKLIRRYQALNNSNIVVGDITKSYPVGSPDTGCIYTDLNNPTGEAIFQAEAAMPAGVNNNGHCFLHDVNDSGVAIGHSVYVDVYNDNKPGVANFTYTAGSAPENIFDKVLFTADIPQSELNHFYLTKINDNGAMLGYRLNDWLPVYNTSQGVITSWKWPVDQSKTYYYFEPVPDSDNDGVIDAVEIQLGLDPLNSQDAWSDSDGDRLPLVLELSEGLDRNSKDNDVFNNRRLLVQQAYVDMQHRLPTDDKIDLWLAQPATTVGPAQIYNALLDEAHFAHLGFIGRVYQAVLSRAPDAGGVRYYQQLLINNLSKQQMVDGFVNSAEFQNGYGSLSNGDFIHQIYLNVLGRAADDSGFNYYLDLLNNGSLSRGQMMMGFIDSPEYINREDVKQRVEALSLLLTGQLPSSAHSEQYQQWLINEGHAISVLGALLSSDGYRQNLMANISGATDDTDLDGMPDGVEFVEGYNVNVKDNDINGNSRLLVKQMLRDMIGETWSGQQISEQLTALNQAATRADWVKQIMNDEAFKARESISRLYFSFFLRRPDHAGLINWATSWENGMTLQNIAEQFVLSGEFVSRYGSLTTGQFVELVYQNVLNRLPDSGGYANWVNLLDSGAISRAGMMVGFSESPENMTNSLYRDQVVALFNLLYRRDLSDSDLNNWTASLTGGTDVKVLIDHILASAEYQARF